MPLRAALLILLLVVGGALRAQAPFVRGDFNADGAVDISDPLSILFHLFLGASAPPCLSAGDVNDDGIIELPDAVVLLEYLFRGGAPPGTPFPACGPDGTSDDLGCAAHPPCAPPDGDPEITEFRVPYGGRPRDPYVDGLGRVWFVGQTGDYAAFLEPVSGEFMRFDLPDGSAPHNLIVSDRVWYAGNGDAHIGRLDPETKEILVIDMPDPAADDPHTLVFDQAGDIWFTVQNGNFAGRLAPATGKVDLVRVPTSNARPYGIAVDSRGRPWFVESGTNKIAMIDPGSLSIEEFTLTRSGARPRRIAITSDDIIWYVDFARGFLGRFDPETEEIEEWPSPGGAGSRPYGMAADHRDRIWFVETGVSPNRFVGFNPATETFFSRTAIPSGAGSVRHMYYHAPAREVWFGTDAGTVGRARVE